MRFLILFVFLVNNAFASEISKIKNIIIHNDPKTYDNVIFLDNNDQKINLKKFKGNLILLNFWATWCEPCKEEMPSLDKLQINPKFKNLKIITINVGRDNNDKANEFFNELDFEPGNLPENSISPDDIAKIIFETTNTRKGTVIDEVNLSPATSVVRFKAKRPKT